MKEKRRGRGEPDSRRYKPRDCRHQQTAGKSDARRGEKDPEAVRPTRGESRRPPLRGSKSEQPDRRRRRNQTLKAEADEEEQHRVIGALIHESPFDPEIVVALSDR